MKCGGFPATAVTRRSHIVLLILSWEVDITKNKPKWVLKWLHYTTEPKMVLQWLKFTYLPLWYCNN